AVVHQPHSRQQKSEDDDEEQRLERGAHQEIWQLAASDGNVAQQDGQKNARWRDRFVVHASFLPVSEMNSVSRLGRERWMSRTARPLPSPTAMSEGMISPARRLKTRSSVPRASAFDTPSSARAASAVAAASASNVT